MSTTTVAYKIPRDKKEFVNDVLKHVADHNMVKSKGEAFLKLFEIYSEVITEGKIHEETDIDAIKLRVNCGFLSYEGSLGGWVCTERFYKRKKVDPIGDAENVIERCDKCKIGQDYQRRLNIEKLLTKQGVKKLIELHKSLSQLVQRGLDIKAYCCSSILFQEGKLIVSTDGLRLPCIYEENELVSISQICKERLNEKSKAPPCAFLIDLLVRGDVTDIQDIVKEYEETLLQLPKQIEDATQEPKIIDAEVKIISDDDEDEESDEKKDDEE